MTREFSFFGGFFLLVMAAAGLLAYFVFFRDRGQESKPGDWMEAFRRIGQAAPVRPQEADRLRRRLGMAGYRMQAAAPIYSGIRVACSVLVGLATFAIGASFAESWYRALLAAMCAALFGFQLPALILSRRIKRRSARLRAGMPTMFDLLVLSLEAGQSLDAALNETRYQRFRT